MLPRTLGTWGCVVVPRVSRVTARVMDLEIAELSLRCSSRLVMSWDVSTLPYIDRQIDGPTLHCIEEHKEPLTHRGRRVIGLPAPIRVKVWSFFPLPIYGGVGQNHTSFQQCYRLLGRCPRHSCKPEHPFPSPSKSTKPRLGTLLKPNEKRTDRDNFT